MERDGRERMKTWERRWRIWEDMKRKERWGGKRNKEIWDESGRSDGGRKM